MATIIEGLEMLAANGWGKEWQNPAWKQFVLTGDEKLLKKLPKFKDHSWLPSVLLDALPVPDKLDIHAKRFLQACYVSGVSLISWIAQCVEKGNSAGEDFTKACALLMEFGCSKYDLVSGVVQNSFFFDPREGLPSYTRDLVLSLDDNLVEKLYREIGYMEMDARGVVTLFATTARERWRRLLEKFRRDPEAKRFVPITWTIPLKIAPAEFLEVAAETFDYLDEWYSRFELGKELYVLDTARFGPAMEKLTINQLLAEDTCAQCRLWIQASESAKWLIANRGTLALPHLKSYFAAPLDAKPDRTQEYKNEALQTAAQYLGCDAVPLFEACFETEQPEVQLYALQLWAALQQPPDAKAIAPKLRKLFTQANPSIVARAVRLASDLDPESIEDDLWSLLSHKSRPVRDAAAHMLGKLGESRLPKAKELWGARRADTRLATVVWLGTVGTDKAAATLKARLDEEGDDNVRDAILLVLEKFQGGSMKMEPAEMNERIKKTLAKITGAPVEWLDPKNLPTCKLFTGSKLSPEWLLYLLYRQSRVKDMRPDIEAKPLYAQIDRQTSGDLALAVLQAFFGSEADADDRWAMAFAAIIGDNRLVPIFTRQIKEWADNMRGKLAEYAVQALALMGTDAALLAVDAMTIRYRSKNKNIGKAASEAFAEAARARGLTVEELGDLVVPWLGFEPGKPRIVDTGKVQLEVHISNEFKLTFRDADTKKKVAKLPDSAPAELKAEFKELSTGLKEAVKSQLLRMETLMVRQFRWPVARWQELYLQHPLLLPFAQRLVWGTYEKPGKLAGTFRTPEDHSLTDAADEPFVLAPNCEVGILHPLELAPEVRQAWLKHLADYDVVPPFAQLERSVVSVKPEQENTKFGKEVAGTNLNAMTFKGRAERLGWTRGSVCDAGCINFYVKSFPSAGVDVFVETEGMYVGIDMYSDIKLGKIFFVKNGSVQIGSYIYDEPSEAKDPRLVSYGDVPPIAFSEAMGDLVKISGKSESPTTEAADA